MNGDAVDRRPNQTAARSLVKTAGYRVLMVIVTVAVAYAVTGQVDQSLGIGIAANAVKTGTYLGYERLWARIDWGSPPRAPRPTADRPVLESSLVTGIP